MNKQYICTFLMMIVCLVGFSQSEIKATAVLKLTIFKGDAYNNWYKYSHGNDRKIREYEAELLNASTDQEKKTIQAILNFRKDRKQKADRREKKSVVLHSVDVPITLVFKKNNSNELPWKGESVQVYNNAVYEDSYLKVEISNIEIQDYTSQNTFKFSAKIVNKHVLYPNLKNEMVHDVVDVVFFITINYHNGKFEYIPTSSWSGGSVYKNKAPRIYKTNHKQYSFITFLDRFEEDMMRNVQAVLQPY